LAGFSAALVPVPAATFVAITGVLLWLLRLLLLPLLLFLLLFLFLLLPSLLLFLLSLLLLLRLFLPLLAGKEALPSGTAASLYRGKKRLCLRASTSKLKAA
jgi:hypothetical protein